jgi:hypothetical protein
MKKMNEKGDLLDVVAREAQLTKGMCVFSERYKLIAIVKQGDLQYDIINNAARGGFWLLFGWGAQSMPQPLNKKWLRRYFGNLGHVLFQCRNSFLAFING